jgi:hypothetical protein
MQSSSLTEEDGEILSSEFIYSEAEILAEFQECFEAAAEAPGQPSVRLKIVTSASNARAYLCMCAFPAQRRTPMLISQKALTQPDIAPAVRVNPNSTEMWEG